MKQLAEHSVVGDYDYIDFKLLFVQATVKTESEENAIKMLDKYAYRIKGSHSQPLLALYATEIQSYAAGNTGRSHYERIGKSLICM